MSATPFPRLILLLALLAAAIVGMTFASLNTTDFVRQSECRTAVVAREMLDSGNFLIPTVNGRARFEKPPLYYWAIVLAAGADHEVNETVARLPSVLSAALAVLGLGLFARRRATALEQPATAAGWLAALILLCLPGFWQRATLADAESLLALTCFAVSACLYWQLRQLRPGLLLWAYVLSAMAFLVKGPVFLLFTWPAYLWLARREWKTDRRWHGLGLLLFLLLAFSWYGAVLWNDPHAFDVFHRELAMRFDSKEATHPQPIWFYFSQIFESTLPLGLFLPPTLYAAWQRRKDRAEAYLLANTAIAFAGLTLLKTKQAHYLLPLLPWAALWLADLAWANWKTAWRWPVWLWIGTGGLASAAAAVLTYAYGLPWLAAVFALLAVAAAPAALGTVRAPIRAALVWTLLLVTGAYAANEAIFKPLRGLKFEHDAYFAALRRLAATDGLALGFDDACFYYGYGLPAQRASQPTQATNAAYWLSDAALAGNTLRNYHAARLEWLWQRDAGTLPPAASTLLTATSGQMTPAAELQQQTARQARCLKAELWTSNDAAVLHVRVLDTCSAHDLLQDLQSSANLLQERFVPWKLLWLEANPDPGLHGWLRQQVLTSWVQNTDATVVLDTQRALNKAGKHGTPLLISELPPDFTLTISGDLLELSPPNALSRRWQRQADGTHLTLQATAGPDR